MQKPNFKLKGALVEAYGNQAGASRDLGMREDRLSRIIHGRAKPSIQEKRIISKKLKKGIADLFPED